MSASEPIISMRRLTMSYGPLEVLKGIDLDIAPGQIVGYIGPNGAGKTTTIKILAGMLAGFGGEVRVCGFDVVADPLEVKRLLGYVPESAELYEQLTAREFLQFVGQIHGLDGRAADSRAEAMADVFDLSAALDDRMESYSKGMRQKVLLISGMIHDPRLLFFDEPLSGLDANSAILVKEILGRLAAAGRTIFYSSHVMDVVERVCDRIVILDRGRVVADGPFEELQARQVGASLERIFTQLTSAASHEALADRFLAALELRG